MSKENNQNLMDSLYSIRETFFDPSSNVGARMVSLKEIIENPNSDQELAEVIADFNKWIFDKFEMDIIEDTFKCAGVIVKNLQEELADKISSFTPVTTIMRVTDKNLKFKRTLYSQTERGYKRNNVVFIDQDSSDFNIDITKLVSLREPNGTKAIAVELNLLKNILSEMGVIMDCPDAKYLLQFKTSLASYYDLPAMPELPAITK